MNAKIDLNELAVFVRVADAGSFSAVARHLGVPTSTVSRAVARLEDSLGTVLFQRTTRRIHLTREGSWLRERSRQAIVALENAAVAVKELQGRPKGVLRIAAPQDLGHLVVAELVRRYSLRYPDVRVELRFSGRLVDLVAEGFDVALRAGSLRDSSLVARKLGELQTHVVAAPGYMQAHGPLQRPEDLVGRECILFRGDEGTQIWKLSKVRPKSSRAQRVTVRGSIDSDDYGFNRELILQGGGLGMLPRVLCADDLREGRLINALPEYAGRGGSLYVVYPATRKLAPRVAALRDLALETFRRG